MKLSLGVCVPNGRLAPRSVSVRPGERAYDTADRSGAAWKAVATAGFPGLCTPPASSNAENRCERLLLQLALTKSLSCIWL
jgi:hypothetical protein